MLTAEQLTSMQSTVELTLADTCTIRRDAPGADDDTLDQVTGLLVPPANDSSVVYEGPCRVAPDSVQENLITEGRSAMVAQRYVGAIPWDAPQPSDGDILTVNTSADPRLVGRSFRIRSVVSRQYAIQRILAMEERE